MSTRTLIPLLCLSLALAACKKNPEEDPPACKVEKRAVIECGRQLTEIRESLDTCVHHAKASPMPAEAPVDDPPVKIKSGAIYVLLQGAEVVVMNERSVSDARWAYPYGSTCRVDPDAKVKVVGPHVEEDGGPAYLVRYFRDPAPSAQNNQIPDEDPLPRECPDHTLFFIDDPTVLFEDTPDARVGVVRKLLDSEKH